MFSKKYKQLTCIGTIVVEPVCTAGWTPASFSFDENWIPLGTIEKYHTIASAPREEVQLTQNVEIRDKMYLGMCFEL